MMYSRLQPNTNRRVRNRVRARGVGTQNCIVSSHAVYDINLGASDTSYFFFRLNAFDANCHQAVCASLAANYEFYRIRSLSVEYIPTGGTNEVGRTQCAFIENSELMLRFAITGDVDRSLMLSSAERVETFSNAFPAVKTFNNSRVKSRSWFHTNVSVTADANSYDRSIATMFVARVNSQPNTNVGSFVFHVTYEFSGLGASGAETLLLSRADGGYRLFYPGDATHMPPVVTLATTLGDTVYDMCVPKPPPLLEPQPQDDSG